MEKTNSLERTPLALPVTNDKAPVDTHIDTDNSKSLAEYIGIGFDFLKNLFLVLLISPVVVYVMAENKLTEFMEDKGASHTAIKWTTLSLRSVIIALISIFALCLVMLLVFLVINAVINALLTLLLGAILFSFIAWTSRQENREREEREERERASQYRKAIEYEQWRNHLKKFDIGY